jgi:tRNA threonylcarbamoyladenosine biosynthesis protein TsaE
MKTKSTSPEMTRELGEKLAGKLQPGSVLALEGELGAGKTCFVQGLAKGFGVPGNVFVRSPSFTILNQYDGKLSLYHFDFYRLTQKEELGDLGLEEYFDGDGITIVEWADRFEDAMPPKTQKIYFKIIDENTREIELPT